MAENYAARKDGKYKVVGMAPDMCFTPGIQPPVPYPVTTTLEPSKSTVNSVKFNGHPAFVYDQSFVPTTIGDAAGKNKGVVSGTVEGDCWSIEHSPDTCIGGHPINRVNDIFAMNGKAVGGRGGANISKHEAWERRKALIAKGKQSADPKVRAAAERLELNNTGVEKARLAENIYGPEKGFVGEFKPPVGWNDISNDPKALAKYGIEPDDLKVEQAPNFKAKVYEPQEDVFGKDLSASVVFRGTQSFPDWVANAKQAVGAENDYYKQAVKIGNKIEMSNAPMDCSGHSLGGGMASACSRASGKPGWTFNAAGLNSKTLKKYSSTEVIPQDGKENIHAYRVKGEMLTGLQEPGFVYGAAMIMALGPVGIGITMLPSSVGEKHDMDGGVGNPKARHSMKQVIHCIEKEKEEDELFLKK